MNLKITPQHYKIADAICRREYEKRFNTDFRKPVGRLFPISNKEDQITLNKDMVTFWHELGHKRANNNGLKKMQPLEFAILTICNNAEFKFLKLLEEMTDSSSEEEN
jgi:hypothetical protein